MRVRFGRDEIELDLDESKLVTRFRGPKAEAPYSIARQFADCLAKPLDAPPLNQAVLADDRITIAVDSQLTRLTEWLAPLLAEFDRAGIGEDCVTILLAGPTRPDEIPNGQGHVSQLASELARTFPLARILEHDATDLSQLAYLANTSEGARIYLNRAIVEADAIVAVGRAGFDPLLGLRGTASLLYPELSDATTLAAGVRNAMDDVAESESLRASQQCDEVARLAGLFYSAAVVLDREGEPDQVWFGHWNSVQQRASAYLTKHWRLDVPESAYDLVVLSVAFNVQAPGWDAVGAALDVGRRLAGSNAKILLIAGIEEEPGETGQWLIDAPEAFSILQRVRQEPLLASDRLSTALTAMALDACPIMLYSRLEAELVESLGMTPLSKPKEVAKVLGRAERYVLVEDADRVAVREWS